MQSNLDKFYKTNKVLEREGIDFVIQEKNEKEGLEEISFKLRRFSPQNPRVKAAMAKHHKPYARQIEAGTLPQNTSDELAIKLFIDVSLVSWVGVKDGEGIDIECNKENALKLFKDLPDLYQGLSSYATEFNSFKEDLGNS